MSIRHAILGVLRDAPMHGYQIAGELERRIGGGRYNGAQVYQGLYALAERGLVVASVPEPGIGRDRRPFAITAEGGREFERWLREPFLPSRPARDDAVVKLVFLGSEDAGRLASMLERLRRQHLRRLAGSKTAEPSGGAQTLGPVLFAELGSTALRFREEAELRWIDHCLLRLKPLLAGYEARADGAGSQRAKGTDDSRKKRSIASVS
jgi:DNA-binding PadR family transcriptional regulator